MKKSSICFFLVLIAVLIPGKARLQPFSLERVTYNGSADLDPAWSPDGNLIAFISLRDSGRRDVWTIGAPGLDVARQLTSDSSQEYSPFWSPDGCSIGFHSDSGGNVDLWKVGLLDSVPVRCTVDLGVDESGNWSADGKWIVYRSDEFTASKNIVMRSSDCGATVPLVVGSMDDHEPAFSPDGTRIAYVRGGSGSRDIWVYTLVDSSETQMTFDVTNVGSPSWSPDGNYIAYYSSIAGNDDIWVLPGFGGSPVQFTTDSGSDREPSWSPDGDMLVFSSNRSGNYDIWTRSFVDSLQAAVQVTDHLGSDLSPAWSPDGSVIAFVSQRSGNRDIWLIGAPGDSVATQLTTAWTDYTPFWSPDGCTIGFHSEQLGAASDIYKISRVGGTGEQCTFYTGVDESGEWSPDGNWVAFNRTYGSGQGAEDILMKSADCDSLVVLTDFTGEEQRPSWHPDGTKIAYTRGNPGLRDVWVYDLETHENNQITFHNGAIGDAKFSPDGVWLAYDYEPAGSNCDIWVVNVRRPAFMFQLTNNAADDRSPSWAPDGKSIAFSSNRTGGWDIWIAKDFWPSVGVGSSEPTVSTSYLDANRPNPFRTATSIGFLASGPQRIQLLVFDVSGRLVRTLFDDPATTGDYSVVWNGLDDRGQHVASGIYLYQLRMGGYAETRKMVLLK